MDDNKKNLKGSESRDMFKLAHKQNCDSSFYATDFDLVLVSKTPPGIVALLDYKKNRDQVTFAEAIAYNLLTKLMPIYIVQGNDPEHGPFSIYEFQSANWRPHPPEVISILRIIVANWDEFATWEGKLRSNYRLGKRGQP